MNKNSLVYIALALQITLAGCAVGNKYDYKNPEISLPVSGADQVGLGVIDNRDYILSGEKSPDFVGLQRGGFGNPFNVTTASGEPLANDFSNSLRRALVQNGFKVKELHLSSPASAVVANIVRKDGTEKNIILKVNEWKTDAMMNFRLIYDLELSIVDKQSKVLAKVTDSGDEILSGAGFESGNSKNASSAFEIKIGRLFNDPKISNILNN